MKKYYYTIISILVIVFGLFSCSNEENQIQNNVTSRPSVPIMANEVQIGTQIWMAKNLNVNRYRNGDPIPQVTDPMQWGTLTIGAWCYYKNETANETVYGKLYNWYAVNDSRGLAPAGYHVPSDVEWDTLTIFLGGGNVAGGKMKEAGTIHWVSPNGDASNSSGFTALPGGYRGGGSFYPNGAKGFWWSSSESYMLDGAWSLFLHYDSGGASRVNYDKVNGYSVRCVKD